MNTKGPSLDSDCKTAWTDVGIWKDSGNDIYNSNTGKVSIGITRPEATLEVDNAVKMAPSATSPGVSVIRVQGTATIAGTINAVGVGSTSVGQGGGSGGGSGGGGSEYVCPCQSSRFDTTSGNVGNAVEFQGDNARTVNGGSGAPALIDQGGNCAVVNGASGSQGNSHAHTPILSDLSAGRDLSWASGAADGVGGTGRSSRGGTSGSGGGGFVQRFNIPR